MTRGRAVLALALLALAWAAAVAIGGGVVAEGPWGRISSRDATRPLAVGVALVLFYAWRWRRRWRDDVAPLARLPHAAVAAGVAAAATLAIGLALGTDIAAGPDASGYVSQATLFAQGRLTRPAPRWALDAPWQDAVWSASPVGYRPGVEAGMLAPIYPPGLPMLMAAALAIGGHAAAFVVVPLLGALAIWATFLLGAHVAGRWEGAMAAVLLAGSPTFLTMLLQPMSDVPATACWTLALLSACRQRPAAAGWLTALAILIRPNLLPAAVVPLLVLLLRAERPAARALRFAAGASPAPLAIAALNWHAFGSPLQSGYGSLSYLYAVDRIWPNALQYAGWLVMTQTPLVALWILAPLAAPASGGRGTYALTVVLFPLVVFGLYLPYLTFQPFEWWYLRFLLPAYPSLLVGLASVVIAAARRIRPRALAHAVPVLVTAFVLWHGWQVAVEAEMLDRRRGDRRYARAVAFVDRLPRDAVILSLSHSGTISLYTGRDVLRFEVLRRDALDPALAHLRALGRPVYFVGDPFEIDLLREQFQGSQALAALDAGPLADLDGAVVYAF